MMAPVVSPGVTACLRPDAWAALRAAREVMPSIVAELLDGGHRAGDRWLAASISGGPGDGIVVELHGRYAGAWRTRDGLCSGDGVDLVATAPRARCGGNRLAAITWLATRVGLQLPPAPARPAPSFVPRPSVPMRAADAETTREMIVETWRNCTPLATGDPVCSFLRGKNILLDTLPRLPPNIRSGFVFNAETNLSRPAMVAAIPDTAGVLTGLYVTWIGKAGRKWMDTRLKMPRKIFGDHAGHFIHLSRGASGQPLEKAPPGEMIAVGAGLAMCLTTAVACPSLRVICSMNALNTTEIALPPSVRYVILLHDRNTAPNPRTSLWMQQAIARFTGEGRAVRVAHAPRPGERAPGAALGRAA